MFDDFLKGFIPPNDALTCLINTGSYFREMKKFTDEQLVEMIVEMVNTETFDTKIGEIVAGFFKTGSITKDERFMLESAIIIRASKMSIGEDGSLVDEFKRRK